MKASNITHAMLVDQLHWSIWSSFIFTPACDAFRVYLVMLSGDKVVNTHRMLGVRPEMPGARHFAGLADFGRRAFHRVLRTPWHRNTRVVFPTNRHAHSTRAL